MSGIFESIRSQMEDVLFQWNKKEQEYLSAIRQLKEENTSLRDSMEDLSQQLEWKTKQLEDLQTKEKTLIYENEKFKLDNEILTLQHNRHQQQQKKKWKLFL